MPYTYKYLRGRDHNPHPAIQVEIISPYNQNLKVETWALVDTGITRTCIPSSIISRLGLRLCPIREEKGEGISYRVYFVHVRTLYVKNFFHYTPVLEVDDSEYLYPIMGLDILNKLCICLDGPNEVLTFCGKVWDLIQKDMYNNYL